METVQGSAASATIDEAVDWYLRHRTAVLGVTERRAFAAWLRTSPLNVREYLAIAALSRDLPDAVDVSPAGLQAVTREVRDENPGNLLPMPLQGALRERPPVQAGRSPVTLSRRVLVQAAGLSVIALGVLAWWAAVAGTYRTAHGEQRTVRLEDGTLMYLNSGSRASVSYTDTERRISIERGQLVVDVVPDPLRPLRVQAGSVQVRAVGTKFDVYRKRDATIVTVFDGRVLVGGPNVTAVSMQAGEQVTVDSRDGMSAIAPVDLSIAAAWLQGSIKFARQPLAEVAAEFNRYNPVPVQIEGDALRGLRVSGILSAYDTASFVEFIRRLETVEVRTAPRIIRVIGREAPVK